MGNFSARVKPDVSADDRIKTHKGKPFRVLFSLCGWHKTDKYFHAFLLVSFKDTHTLILRWSAASWQKFLRQSRITFNASHQGRCSEEFVEKGASFNIIFAITIFNDCNNRKRKISWSWSEKYSVVCGEFQCIYFVVKKNHGFVVNFNKLFLWWNYQIYCRYIIKYRSG